MEAGNGKSLDFRLSQALAYPVVKKGLPGGAASRFSSTTTFSFFGWSASIPLGHPFERLHCGASSAACLEQTKGSIPELACPTETQTVQKPELCPRQGQSGFSQISTNSSGTIRINNLAGTLRLVAQLHLLLLESPTLHRVPAVQGAAMASNRPPLAKSSPNYKDDGPEALLSATERILKDSGTRNAPSERILKKAPISTIGRLGAEIQGSVFECTKCGGEVTLVSVPKDGQALNVLVHVSSITIACP